MINIQEQMEPPVQDQEKNKESEEEDDEKKQVEEGEEFTEDDDGQEELSGLKKEAADTLLSTDVQEKHQQVLNLNNEVVLMRKEVKRVRALIIRKLARQIAALKKKKGKDTDIERHQRRAARLLEEVHMMKRLSPDQVTKTALQKNLNFDQVCKNPKSSLTDRALVRIATHPQFSKKIDDIKTSVKAFEVERSKGGNKTKAQKATQQSARNQEEQEKSGNIALEVTYSEEEAEELKDMKDKNAIKFEKKSEKRSSAAARNTKLSLIVGPESDDSRDVIKITNSKAVENDSNLQPAAVSPRRSAEDDETDADSAGGEEKEYFDDSTEERFYKQSSQSEDSDDDFFLGKVSKLKKRRKKPKTNEMEKEPEGKKDSSEGEDKLQRELDELESRLRPKTTSLQSVFCSSLARRKGGGGEDKRKGFGKFKGQKKVDGRPEKDPTHQKQEKGSSKYSKPLPGRGLPESNTRGFASPRRGVGRDRREAPRQQESKAGGVFSSQPRLHPSWEASRRRKEQQGQILAFQGKKIRFDDD